MLQLFVKAISNPSRTEGLVSVLFAHNTLLWNGTQAEGPYELMMSGESVLEMAAPKMANNLSI